MTQRKKNNIIIGSLCAVVLLMAVGYAAFSSILNIKGTSSISSNWNILITNVDEKNIVGSATNAEEPSWEDLTAIFKTNLVSPGDSIEYDITIENRGNLNATLDKITLTDSNNPAIKFTSSGLEEGSELNAGDSAVLTVKVEYDSNVTSQPESTEGTFTVTLDYSQKDGASGTPGGETAADKLIATEVSTGNGLYADEYIVGRYLYKGKMPNNYITFNGETWRILSVESDGTLKIVRATSIGEYVWDTSATIGRNNARNTYCRVLSGTYYGCNAWGQMEGTWTNANKTGTVKEDATLNTYLNNDYYNSLSSEAQSLIQTHTWGVGPVKPGNSDLAAQITSENETTWTGNIGLMTASEALRAGLNATQCGNLSLNTSNYNTCRTTNYIVPTSGSLWTISPNVNSSYHAFIVRSTGLIAADNVNYALYSVLPVVYIKSDITLSGSGTSTDPFTIN